MAAPQNGSAQSPPNLELGGRRVLASLQMLRLILGVVLTVAAVPSLTAQDRGDTPLPATPLTVCEALRSLKKLAGTTVAVRGEFRYTHRHGGYLLEPNLNAKPCRTMPRSAREWSSGIRLESPQSPAPESGPTSLTTESPSYGDLISMLLEQRNDESLATLTVTLVGEIRTKRDLVIVPAPAGGGDMTGNGYGVGGAFPALLVVKTFREIRHSARK